MPKEDQKEKLSKVLKAGEKGKDKAITKIMEYIPGSSGPPKGLVDFMEPALRKAGKYFRDREEPLEDKKAEKARKDIKGYKTGGKIRGAGIAKKGIRACKIR